MRFKLLTTDVIDQSTNTNFFMKFNALCLIRKIMKPNKCNGIKKDILLVLLLRPSHRYK